MQSTSRVPFFLRYARNTDQFLGSIYPYKQNKDLDCQQLVVLYAEQYRSANTPETYSLDAMFAEHKDIEKGTEGQEDINEQR